MNVEGFFVCLFFPLFFLLSSFQAEYHVAAKTGFELLTSTFQVLRLQICTAMPNLSLFASFSPLHPLVFLSGVSLCSLG